MNFDVVGPYAIERFGSKRLINKDSLSALESVLDDERAGLSEACGCYVFAVRASTGYTPHYVGQAAKRSILDEALNPSNREKYNSVIAERKGSPILFFIPLITPKGRFAKKTTSKLGVPAINFLERWLIATCLDKNQKLINTRETRFLRNIHVKGIFNARRGDSTLDARALSHAIW